MTGAIADAALADVAERFWRGYLHAHPTFSTSIGAPGEDHRLEDPRPAAQAAERSRLAALRAEAAALDPGLLAEPDRITLAALAGELDGAIATIDSGVDRWTVDPLEGVPVGLLNLVHVQPDATPEQGESMVERWRAIGPFVEAVLANLRAARAEGRVAPRAPVERAIAILDELLGQPDDGWSLLEPVRRERPGWPAARRSAFAERLRAAVADVVRPAFAAYRTALVDEVRPAARPDDAAGLGHLPGGEDAYAALIRVHTSLDLTAGELHETGLREIARIRDELAALGQRRLGTRGVAATVAALRGDPALFFRTSDEVRATAERSLARALAAIPRFFGRLPRARCVVEPVPAHEAEHSTIAYYLWPAGDGSRPGRYYVNLSAPETRPRYEAEALAFHESVPGHHLQIAIAQEREGIPDFRRHLGSTAFVEGWGLYSERLADEMGLYSGELDRFGILSFDAWRACRLVVDTGLHAFGWSRDRAVAYVTENTALAANNIGNEVDRYIAWPGQALAYKTGQLELLRLRAAAERRLGARFDVRAFHDAVLANGALPLPALAGAVERAL